MICRLAADCDILIHRGAGRAQCMRLASDLVDGQCLDPEAGQQFQRFCFCDPLGPEILNKVRIHILIKSAVAQ